MNNKQLATLLTGFKYLAWTVLSAGIIEGINQLPNTNLPLWAIPLLASILKSIATWAKTEAGTPVK